MDGLVDYDLHLRRSPVTQSLIENDLREFSNSSTQPDDPAVDLAIYHTTRKFLLSNPVKMLHLNEVFQQDLDIWNKSPGLPWTSYGIKTKGQIRDDPERIRQVRHFWHEIKRGKDIRLPDCCAFVRSHICKDDEHKVRAVWGYPATVTFGEAMFALPLLDAYKQIPEVNKPIAYGFETFNGGAQRVRRRFIRGNVPTCYTALDFSKFDKTVPTWMIRVAFNILRLNIDFVNYRHRGVADARNTYRMFKVIENYFINTTIRMATGKRFRKTSGIASGSYFTQIVGSICNSLALNYMFIKAYGRPPFDALFLGDDSICSMSTQVSLETLSKFAIELGMRVNVEKSNSTYFIDDIIFLGFQINHGLAKKKESDLLASLMFPESPDKRWDDVASRALGLYYANLGMNKDFSEIAWKIVTFSEFEICFGRNFSRMLQFMGIEIKQDTHLPTPVEFLRKLLLYN